MFHAFVIRLFLPTYFVFSFFFQFRQANLNNPVHFFYCNEVIYLQFCVENNNKEKSNIVQIRIQFNESKTFVKI